MKSIDNNTKAFLELVRAGLWEKEARLLPVETVDYEKIMRQADEQSVMGLVTVGLERVKDVNVPKEVVLHFIGNTLQIEQRNKDMNVFVARLIERLRKEGVYALLVKGQGIAQCYERPLWRSCGDVDLLLSSDNYDKAKSILIPLGTSVEPEATKTRHLGITIESWMVELHGTLRSCSLPSMDRATDEVQRDVFYGGKVRSWLNGKTEIFLPSPDNDVIFIFSHIIKHFFHGGIGLRQLCDWCRLLWKYRESLNLRLLQSRIRKAGLMSEWRAFAALAVEWLGMPKEAMPLYNSSNIWKRKADKVLEYIMAVGNFGHNRDMSYYSNKPFLTRKAISFWRQTTDGIHHFFAFPLDSTIVWCRMLLGGVKAIVN